MKGIIATIDAVRSRVIRIDGHFATDFQAMNPQFAAYYSGLNAEPECKPLAIRFATVQDKGRTYGFIENHHYTLLNSLDPQSAMKTIPALDEAWKELDTALTALEDG